MSRSLIHLAMALWTGLIMTSPAAAAQVGEFQCSNGTSVRRVEVVAENRERGVPCEVVYWKDDEAPGVRNVLWSARTDAKFCLQKADDLAERLESGGWRCKLVNSTDSAAAADQAPTPAPAPREPAPDATAARTPPAAEPKPIPAPAPAPAAQPEPATQPEPTARTEPTATSEATAQNQTAAKPAVAPATTALPVAPSTTTAGPSDPTEKANLDDVIERNLQSLNESVDGSFEAKIADYGDLNDDGLQDAVIFFTYESSTSHYTQFIAAYVFDGDTYHLAATKSVGGSDREAQSALVDKIIDGAIMLKLYADTPQDGKCCDTEIGQAAMVLQDGQLVDAR